MRRSYAGGGIREEGVLDTTYSGRYWWGGTAASYRAGAGHIGGGVRRFMSSGRGAWNGEEENTKRIFWAMLWGVRRLLIERERATLVGEYGGFI